jgi:hypothetical protein
MKHYYKEKQEILDYMEEHKLSITSMTEVLGFNTKQAARSWLKDGNRCTALEATKGFRRYLREQSN